MKHYKTILFDLDDTLLDFKGSETLSLKKCYENFFRHHIAEENFLHDYHQINQALWQRVEGGTIQVSAVGGTRFEQLAELYRIPLSSEVRHFYEEELIKNTRWIDGAQILLDTLLAHGVKIGFITNGFSQTQRGKYRELSLFRYSDVLIISEEVGCSKPHPGIFHHTLEKIQAKAEETLMVGDSLTSDGEGARGIQMPFCWYNPHRREPPEEWKPTYVLHDFKELSSEF